MLPKKGLHWKDYIRQLSQDCQSEVHKAQNERRYRTVLPYYLAYKRDVKGVVTSSMDPGVPDPMGSGDKGSDQDRMDGGLDFRMKGSTTSVTNQEYLSLMDGNSTLIRQVNTMKTEMEQIKVEMEGKDQNINELNNKNLHIEKEMEVLRTGLHKIEKQYEISSKGNEEVTALSRIQLERIDAIAKILGGSPQRVIRGILDILKIPDQRLDQIEGSRFIRAGAKRFLRLEFSSPQIADDFAYSMRKALSAVRPDSHLGSAIEALKQVSVRTGIPKKYHAECRVLSRFASEEKRKGLMRSYVLKVRKGSLIMVVFRGEVPICEKRYYKVIGDEHNTKVQDVTDSLDSQPGNTTGPGAGDEVEARENEESGEERCKGREEVRRDVTTMQRELEDAGRKREGEKVEGHLGTLPPTAMNQAPIKQTSAKTFKLKPFKYGALFPPTVPGDGTASGLNPEAPLFVPGLVRGSGDRGERVPQDLGPGGHHTLFHTATNNTGKRGRQTVTPGSSPTKKKMKTGGEEAVAGSTLDSKASPSTGKVKSNFQAEQRIFEFVSFTVFERGGKMTIPQVEEVARFMEFKISRSKMLEMLRDGWFEDFILSEAEMEVYKYEHNFYYGHLPPSPEDRITSFVEDLHDKHSKLKRGRLKASELLEEARNANHKLCTPLLASMVHQGEFDYLNDPDEDNDHNQSADCMDIEDWSRDYWTDINID